MKNLAELGPVCINIITRFLNNQELCKLLYFKSNDPLGQPDIPNTSVLKNENIFFTPRLPSLDIAKSEVAVFAAGGSKNKNNAKFMQCPIRIQVVTPLEQWAIKSDNLRPYAIIGEMQKSLLGKKIGGLGKVEEIFFDFDYVTEEVSCFLVGLKTDLFE